jgi:predicted HTH transcriptional regulator
MGDISSEKLKWFLATARRERNYALSEKTPARKALAHLNLLDGKYPSHAAVLLFCDVPQRFLPTSEVKCMHFHGTVVRKPIPSYQIFKGPLFELVDHAVDFVMSKINRSVGTRALGPQAPVKYELPIEAVTEAVVNAIAHRDYASNASVQVMLFADRLEVWNPGELPPSLTPERLREPHASIPRNPLVAEPLYLARYIEKAGSGTLDMIEKCSEARLPAPDFEERAGQFVTTIWRDWLTENIMDQLGLNELERQVVAFVKSNRQISNQVYRDTFGVSKPTATRHLNFLAKKGILQRVGTTGKGTYYILEKKGLIKGSKGSPRRKGS